MGPDKARPPHLALQALRLPHADLLGRPNASGFESACAPVAFMRFAELLVAELRSERQASNHALMVLFPSGLRCQSWLLQTRLGP